MTFLLTLALVQAASPAPPAPEDWNALPLVYLNRESGVSPDDTVAIMQLVRRRPSCRVEVGHMPTPAQAGNARMVGLRVHLILLVAPDGRILNVLAAPGPCHEIRERSRSLVNGRYRGRIRPPVGSAPAWYRTSLGFSWEP